MENCFVEAFDVLVRENVALLDGQDDPVASHPRLKRVMDPQ